MNRGAKGAERPMRLARQLAGAGLAALMIAQAPAQAQDAVSPEDGATVDQAQDIVVTASRTNVAGFSAPTPTQVVDAGILQRNQATNVADVLLQLPAFKATNSPAANGIRSTVPGSNFSDLRGLGIARTLTLVDGVRIVPQAPSNQGANIAPDLNAIPPLMVQRIDVVTGGSSAQWGSDAVAGVVNVLLRKSYDGIEATGQAGVSQMGDAGNGRLGILVGKDFADGRLHVVGAADYARSQEVSDIYTRKWGRQEYQVLTNGASATNGLPVNLVLPNVRQFASPGLLITGPANFSLNRNAFVSSTAVAPFQVGSLVAGTVMAGGQGVSLAKGLPLVPGIERFTASLRMQYDMSDALRVYVSGNYANTRGSTQGLPSRLTGVIQRTNPYLPASVVAAMTAANITSFNFSRTNYDFVPDGTNPDVAVRNRMPRVVAGIEGDLGADWHWDAHAGWGRNTYDSRSYNAGIRANQTFATDAVLANGVITCRALVPGSTTYNPVTAAGCVPINLFGNGTPSAAAVDYVTGDPVSRSVYVQKTAAANLRGEPFSTWAGPVAVAVGAEYRREHQRVTSDAIASVGGYEFNNALPFSGRFNVKEAYVEAIVPLLRDSAAGKSLDLNGAVRVADYSTVGTQTSWKAGATYSPIDGLRFRGTRSLDIRAPSLWELYSPGSVATASIAVRGFTVNIPSTSARGNPNLSPEKADTLTFGAVVNPVARRSLNVSVDYYDINLRQAITSLSTPNVGVLCTAGNQSFCDQFTFDPVTGAPTSVFSIARNLASVRTKGIDVAVSDRTSIPGFGGISLSVAGTYTFKSVVNNGSGVAPVDRAGENGSVNAYAVPTFRGNGTLSFDFDPLTISTQVIYIARGKIDNVWNTLPSNTANLNRVPSVTYVNLRLNLAVSEQMDLFAASNNLFDVSPPVVPNAVANTPTNGQYYDVIGRTFQVGFRVKF